MIPIPSLTVVLARTVCLVRGCVTGSMTAVTGRMNPRPVLKMLPSARMVMGGVIISVWRQSTLSSVTASQDTGWRGTQPV